MASKFAHLISKFPDLPPENPSNQEQVEKIKDELRITLLNPEALAKEYQVVRTAKEDLAEQLSIIQMRLTAVEQLLIESNGNDDPGWGLYGASPNMVALVSGATVAVQAEPTGKVENPDQFRLWCIKNGYENSLALHSGTMNSITKDLVVDGKPAPDGIKVYMRNKIVWRKG